MESEMNLQEITLKNSKYEERLKKMKSGIQSFQKRLNQQSTKIHNGQEGTGQREKIYLYQGTKPENVLTPQSLKSSQGVFAFNSTLFKNINNDSQTFLENASGVSNFSSVANINEILNQNATRKSHPRQSEENLLQNLDKIIEKAQRTTRLPTKAFQKYIDSRGFEESSNFNVEKLKISNLSNKSVQFTTTKNKLAEYKTYINKFESNPKEPQRQKNYLERDKFFYQTEKEYRDDERYDGGKIKSNTQNFPKYHLRGQKKSELSSDRSELNESQFYSKYPSVPLPQKKILNSVERQKALIKQSMQSYKKLQTQIPDGLDKQDIDFQLSEEEEDLSMENNQKIEKLFNQKRKLEIQLKQIQRQLNQLENQQ